MLVKAEHFENNHRSEEISPDVLVMLGGMVLGPIVGEILLTRLPIDADWHWHSRSQSQWKCMSMALVRFGWILLCATASAMTLSLWRGLTGC